MKLTEPELAIVLAALRLWQIATIRADGYYDDLPLREVIACIAKGQAAHNPLSIADVDDLCERLNDPSQYERSKR